MWRFGALARRWRPRCGQRRSIFSQDKLDSVVKDMSPMLRQYLSFKRAHGSRVLMFRVGDFYECFFSDAHTLASTCSITLTSISAGKKVGRVPMAGVPMHAVDRYVSQLVDHGHSVVLADQVAPEYCSPADRTESGLMNRSVTRIVTPSTVASRSDHSFLAAVCPPFCMDGGDSLSNEAHWGLAMCDSSTGDYLVGSLSLADIVTHLQTHQPKEIICPSLPSVRSVYSAHIAPYLNKHFFAQPEEDYTVMLNSAQRAMTRFITSVACNAGFSMDTSHNDTCVLNGVPHVFRDTLSFIQQSNGREETSDSEPFSALTFAKNGLAAYLHELHGPQHKHIWHGINTSKIGEVPLDMHLKAPKSLDYTRCMQLDGLARRNLELTEVLYQPDYVADHNEHPHQQRRSHFGREGTFYHAINRTKTWMGARVLRDWIERPLMDLEEIKQRHDCVEMLAAGGRSGTDCELIGGFLNGMSDLHRVGGRIALGNVTLRDLRSIAKSCSQLPAFARQIHVPDHFAAMNAFAQAVTNSACVPLKDVHTLSAPRGGDVTEQVQTLVVLSENLRMWLRSDDGCNDNSKTGLAHEKESSNDEVKNSTHGRKNADNGSSLREKNNGERKDKKNQKKKKKPTQVGAKWLIPALPEFIQTGVHNELDRLRALHEETQTWMQEYLEREKERLGVESAGMKIGYARQYGFYISFSKALINRKELQNESEGEALFPSAEYTLQRVMKNEIRFSTPALQARERDLITARERAQELERQLYQSVIAITAQYVDLLRMLGDELAALDIFRGWALLANELQYARPIFAAEPESNALVCQNLRHVVVESHKPSNTSRLPSAAEAHSNSASADTPDQLPQTTDELLYNFIKGPGHIEYSQEDEWVIHKNPRLRNTSAHGEFSSTFVANSVALGHAPVEGEWDLKELGIERVNNQPLPNVIILTGPNAAGKSCYLRSIALAQIMAQIGSFVPADAMYTSVCDAIYTRVGALDDISSGRSSFVVEMNEVSRILRKATRHSLVLLDEVGRGTSSRDGLAIAQATVENLASRGSETPLVLFATHYHELNSIADDSPCVQNFHFGVDDSLVESDLSVVFDHKVRPGPTNESHGVACARMAGLPVSVVDRAWDLVQGYPK